MIKDIDQQRRDYDKGELTRESLSDDPIEQFNRWLEQTIAAGLGDSTAMTVATVDSNGQPSQRIVLLKHVDREGFVFYTNLESRKAQDLAQNPKVSLHFPWHQLERQVKVCGEARKVSVAQALKYFSSRPKESQLAAWASAQSRPISSRQLLLQQFNKMKSRFAKGEVPLPDFWGGYLVVPHEIEFWQGGVHRLHDRFVYTREEQSDRWSIDRLAP